MVLRCFLGPLHVLSITTLYYLLLNLRFMHFFNTSLSYFLHALSLIYSIATFSRPWPLTSINPYSSPFNPRLYHKTLAHCPAFNRSEGEYTSLDLGYVDLNPEAGSTLVFVHGWPGLWSTWSNQIQHFEKTHRLILPDLRGFGASTHPGDVETSGSMADMVSDLACVLRHAGVQHKVVCVGHDWGAQICWEAARMRPDLIGAAAGAVIPYISAHDPFMPIEQLSALLPRLTYMAYFEKKTRIAAEELDSDVRRTLRAVMRDIASPPPIDFLTSSESFLDAWKGHNEIPAIPFLTRDEEDYIVEQYSLQGFKNTFQFYTHGNRFGSWSFDRAQCNFSIPQPALYLLPTNDPVADWVLASAALKSSSFFSQLTTHKIDTAHWPQLENPEEFNRILQEWLEGIPQYSS